MKVREERSQGEVVMWLIRRDICGWMSEREEGTEVDTKRRRERSPAEPSRKSWMGGRGRASMVERKSVVFWVEAERRAR